MPSHWCLCGLIGLRIGSRVGLRIGFRIGKKTSRIGFRIKDLFFGGRGGAVFFRIKSIFLEIKDFFARIKDFELFLRHPGITR